MTKSTSSSGFFMKSVLSLSVWGQNSGRKVKERTFFYSPPSPPNVYSSAENELPASKFSQSPDFNKCAGSFLSSELCSLIH